MASDDSRISSLFNCHVNNFVGDVSNVDYNKYSIDTLDNFLPARSLFCDNITVRKLVNYTNILAGNYSVAALSNLVRSILMDIGFLYFHVSFLRFCTHEVENDVYASAHYEYAQTFDNYVPGYALFKVSLSGENFSNVLQTLTLYQKRLHSNLIFVYDIDITLDCAGNIKRADILQFLLSKNIPESDIINNVHKVGNNSISWKMVTGNDIPIRCKTYNKFVQTLESSEVRQYIGSRISDLVANSSQEFRSVLKFCKNDGLTRFEIKTLYNILYEYSDYVCLMNDLLLFMQGCKIYKTSFENQWKSLVDDIDNMNVLAIYISNRKIFAYCHWYNFLTSKKQGCIKHKINENQIPTLLTNYCFNTGKLCYMTVKDTGHIYTVLSTSHYKRVTKGVTLVPGPNNSLNPEKRKINFDILSSFADMGLVEYKGIHLDWPLTTTTLSELEEVVTDDQSMKTIVSINNREYRNAHLCLLRHTRYKVSAMRFGTYRNNDVVYVILYTDDNSNSIKTKLFEFGVKLFKTINTSHVFYIKTGNFIYSENRHLVDIEVFLDSSMSFI